MTKQEVQKKLELSDKDLKELLNSCGYLNIKEFNDNHIKTMKSYMQQLDISPDDKSSDKKEIAKNTSIEVINSNNLIVVPRKELMQLIAKAYNEGYNKGLNSIPISGEVELQALFNAAIEKTA